MRVYLERDTFELARFFQRSNKLPQIAICHIAL
jgi:hypothetical protein